MGKCCSMLMLELAIDSKARDVARGSETRVLVESTAEILQKVVFCITLGPASSDLTKTLNKSCNGSAAKVRRHTGAHSRGLMLQTY